MQVHAPDINMLEQTQGDKQDIVPAILPFFHIYGFTSLSCASMHVGAKIVTMTQFIPELYAKVLLQHKPTVLFVVPPIGEWRWYYLLYSMFEIFNFLVIFLYAHPMITKKHLESVRVSISGAAPLGALDIIKFQQKADTNIKVIQGNFFFLLTNC